MGMALQDILERKEILLKPNDMTNDEEAREIMETFAEVYGVNIERDSHIYSACKQMAQWKDEQLANCIECLEKEYIKNSGKGLLSNEEIAAKLATLKRIKEEMK